MNEEIHSFVSQFRHHFQQYKSVPLVLYGIGEKTKWILDNLPEFQVIGLMDRDTTGRIIYGKKVLHPDEVSGKTRIIIIVANMAANRIIYNRIRYLHEIHGISIFFTDGTIPVDENPPASESLIPQVSIEEIQERIQQADVISFDLFDTLVMRKTLLPTDVLDLVGMNIKGVLHPDFDIKVSRIEAEKKCYTENEFYTLDDVYKQLQEMNNFPPELTNRLKEEEIKTEIHVAAQRISMVDLYCFAKKIGKTVCITTDTYFDRAFILQLLQQVNIPLPDHLYISNELKRSKGSGTIWINLKEQFHDASILHIGDNQVSDYENAIQNDISAILVPSGYDLMRYFLGPFDNYTRTIVDRVALGLLSTRFLNSPFILQETNRRLPISTMYDLGYLCFGPLVFSFTWWLIDQVEKYPSAKVLFFARDGYLLKELYEYMAEFLGITVPQGIYLLTSRRSASVISLENKEDIQHLVESMCRYKKNTIRDILSLAFGLEAGKDDPILDTQCFELEDEVIMYIISEQFGDHILRKAEEERALYLSYLDSLGLRTCEQLICVNFVGRGATQFFISKVMGKPMTGYYFAIEEAAKQSFFQGLPMEGLYDRYQWNIANAHLLKHYVYGEVILSAPDEQFIAIDTTGRPVYDSRGTVRDFSKVGECHEGIKGFIKDLLTILHTNLEPISLEIVDSLYGCMMSDKCQLSDDVRTSFVFKDYYDVSTPQGHLIDI